MDCLPSGNMLWTCLNAYGLVFQAGVIRPCSILGGIRIDRLSPFTCSSKHLMIVPPKTLQGLAAPKVKS